MIAFSITSTMFGWMPSVGSSSSSTLGSRRERARHRQLLLLPAGEQPARPVEILHQIGKQLRHDLGDLAADRGGGEGAHQDVLPD